MSWRYDDNYEDYEYEYNIPIPEKVLHPPYCPNKVKKRVEALESLHKQYKLLDKDRKTKAREMPEGGWGELYEQLYQKRYEIVNGIVEVDTVTQEASEGTSRNSVIEEVQGIPNFWCDTLDEGVVYCEVTEADKMALGFLQDIKVRNLKNPMRVRLEFVFECNPFFKNSVLTKTYHLRADGKKLFATKAIGTEIEWYPGQCITKVVERSMPERRSRSTNPVIKFESCESFFHYFRTRECDIKDAFEFNADVFKFDDDGTKDGDATKDSVNIDDDGNRGGGFHDTDNRDGDSPKEEDYDDGDDDEDEDDDGDEDEDVEDDASEEDDMTWANDYCVTNMLLRYVIPKAVKWYVGDITYRNLGDDSCDDGFDSDSKLNYSEDDDSLDEEDY